MVKVKCPTCGTEIELDKSTYNELLNDIAGEEVDKRVKEQTKAIEASFNAKLALEQEKARNAQEKEIQELKQKNASLQEQINTAVELEKTKAKAEADKEIAELKQKNATLQEQLNNSDNNAKLQVAEAVEAVNEKLAEQAASEKEKKLKEQYEFQLDAKEQEIEKWKNYRVGDSTKALGESLEQYCSDAFNEVRSYAYPRAYFEKDNEVDEEGKGDFIFKDFAEDGTEIVSIMFEMKNQNDTTKTKHKNEHFFDKLDKNRTSKKCEYAVLVSTLEEDSKLYNSGIVDVSYRYPKMYVIRPQHFLAIIGLLKNMALNNLAYKQQVITYQRENVDITNFEDTVRAIADKINSDYEKAGNIYAEVDKMCDDIVNKVEKFRKEFKTATGWIEKAKNQLPNLEIRKLTHNNPTMKAKFDALKEDKFSFSPRLFEAKPNLNWYSFSSMLLAAKLQNPTKSSLEVGKGKERINETLSALVFVSAYRLLNSARVFCRKNSVSAFSDCRLVVISEDEE